jgi:hypothetical protein
VVGGGYEDFFGGQLFLTVSFRGGGAVKNKLRIWNGGGVIKKRYTIHTCRVYHIKYICYQGPVV